MEKIKALLKKHGVTVSLAGASLVIGTAYGSCVLSPDAPSAPEVAEVAEEPKPEEAPTEEAPEEAPSEEAPEVEE
tara:strand:+ start:812 stop:1036 length:225 start_codon:yes stop_codon:yes gene_type:complete